MADQSNCYSQRNFVRIKAKLKYKSQISSYTILSILLSDYQPSLFFLFSFFFPFFFLTMKKCRIYRDEFDELPISNSLLAGFAVRFQSSGWLGFWWSFHGFGKGAWEVWVEINDPSNVVVKLPDEAYISVQIIGDFRLMVLVNLID